MGAVRKDLVVGELVEEDPDDLLMRARRLRSRGPGRVVLVGAGLPAHDEAELDEADDGEDGEEDSCSIAAADREAIPLGELAQHRDEHDAPDDHADDERAGDGEGNLAPQAFDEVPRQGDRERKANDGVVAGLLEADQADENERGQNEDVRHLGEADADQRKGDVHANVAAPAEQVAVVHDQNERRKPNALGELLRKLQFGHSIPQCHGMQAA